MRILVAGANRVDAGKTTFSVGLVERTDAVGYKPRAGNDYWFDHDDVQAALEEGRLYGKDAKRLAAASSEDVSPEEINAVHRLWRPSPGNGAGLLGQDDREFVVDRVRAPAADDRSADGDSYVVNETVDVPPAVRDALPLRRATRVDAIDGFNGVMADLHASAQRRLAERIAATDRTVVESYGDVARPYQDVDPDAVAVVEPRRVRIYEGTRYEKACEVASGGPGDGRLEERVSAVVDLLDAERTVGLPALGSDERADPDAVASAYESAYDAVLATAFG